MLILILLVSMAEVGCMCLFSLAGPAVVPAGGAGMSNCLVIQSLRQDIQMPGILCKLVMMSNVSGYTSRVLNGLKR